MSLFDFFKKKSPPNQEHEKSTVVEKPTMVEKPTVKVSITTSVGYVDITQKTKGIMEMADIEGYISPSGGYVNYACYYVTGKNAETGRKKKKKYETQDEDSARALAIKDGLVEPFEIVIEKMPEPTENQIEYARDLEAVVPDDACKYDVSAIISRITDEDELPPDAGLSRYAHSCGVRFSRFVGQNAMLGYMIAQMKEAQLGTLYAYAVFLQEKGGDFSDPRMLPIYDTLKACGNYVAQDAGLLKSLEGRDAYDFRRPNRGTKIYKAVAEYLQIKK